ncbi:MAG TPA: winged helix DNA-binding domain-containing protein [Spirochaetia bacterium]|nr:winged helix DNA-binding domain-containing protein [Spirochaetia bacterium]
MKAGDLARLRLNALMIGKPDAQSPAELVARLCAMQGQDYAGTLWAIGLRLNAGSRADIESAVAAGTIVRSWPLRSTLHFVAAADLRWMLTLLGPRLISASAGRNRQLELTESDFSRSRTILSRALEGGTSLTRAEAFEKLNGGGVSTAGQRGTHILHRLSLEKLLCFGPHRGKQPTFVLFDEWVIDGADYSREESLRNLAERYFRSHGPARIEDFINWSGLTVTDAKAGLKLTERILQAITVDDRKYWMSNDAGQPLPLTTGGYLLPGFDEFLLGYRDRSAVLSPEHADAVCPGGNGMFRATLVLDGQVCGTWKAVTRRTNVTISASLFRPLRSAEIDGFDAARRRYEDFVGLPVSIEWPSA